MLVIIGWINIYSSTYNESIPNMLAFSQRAGSQLVWIGIAFTLSALIIYVINPRIYLGLSWWFYLAVIILLAATLVIGKEVNGSKSWLMIGPFGLQPSELSKITSSLCLAAMMSKYGFRINKWKDFCKAALTLLVPIIFIALEPDMGTILVYCGFIFVFYREGMPGWILLFIGLMICLFIITLKYSPFVAILVLIGVFGLIRGILSKKIILNIFRYGLMVTAFAFIPRLLKIDFIADKITLSPDILLLIIVAILLIIFVIKGVRHKIKYLNYYIICSVCSLILVFSVDFLFDHVLKVHHRDRIENLLGITQDLQGAGYNVNQSKIAIGSGGLWGKGFLHGTQTKFNFVPEQSTDFIFCTIGEEWGFLGSLIVLSLFFIMIANIISTAEKHKDKFSRIYGYCVASCLFMHVVVNIGMTIGLMPVVGIPLPFISYGGSSFLSFTVLLFIYIKLDVERWR